MFGSIGNRPRKTSEAEVANDTEHNNRMAIRVCVRVSGQILVCDGRLDVWGVLWRMLSPRYHVQQTYDDIISRI